MLHKRAGLALLRSNKGCIIETGWGACFSCRRRASFRGKVMMRVLLVNTNRNRFLAPPPIGLAYLAGALRGGKHNFRVLDLMFSRNPERELRRMLDEYNPAVAGFSIRNLDNQSMLHTHSPLPEIQKFVSMAQDRKTITVLGGTAFTTLPVQMISYMNADYGIAGQGEDSLTELLESLEWGSVNTCIPGLVWRDGAAIRTNPPRIKGYESACVPDWDAIDIRRYRQSIWPVSVVVKSGCSYRCSYCDAHATFGRTVHSRSADAVLEEIRKVITDYGIRVFYLSDPCFNASPEKAKEILDAIVESGLRISFSTTLMPIPGSYDAEYFTLYRRAGGTFAILGVETFSERMLKNYHKPFSISDVYECAMLAHRKGITFGLELLVGGPGENEATVRESMAFLPRIKAALLLYSIGIRILPDTEIYHRAVVEGIVSGKDELLFPKFYVSRDLDVMWAARFIRGTLRHYWYRSMGMIPCAMRNALARYCHIIL